MWFSGSLLLLLSLSLICLMAGWSIIWLIQSSPQTNSAERFATAALLGSGAIMLVFGLCSHLGLKGAHAGPVVLGVTVCVFLLSLARQLTPDFSFLNLIGFGRRHRVLLGICLLGAVISLLSLLVYHAYNPLYNDAFTYLSTSDYLQQQPFSVTADPNPYFPILTQPLLYQWGSFRMGGLFFLAFVQSIAPVERAIEIYPTVTAWAVVLDILAIYLGCRWLLRLTHFYALVAAVLAAIMVNPIHLAAGHAFLPQLFGTAFFVFTLGVFARLLRRRAWDWTLIVYFSLGLAILISAYYELFPVLGLIMLLAWAGQLIHSRGYMLLWLKLASAAALLTVIFANIEILRMLKGLPGQIGAVVASNIGSTPLELLGMAVGAAPASYINNPSMDPLLEVLTIGLTLFLLWGVGTRLVRRFNQSQVFLMGLLVFALLFVYYAWFVENPWVPGQTGQTWSMYKLTQWVYPLTLIGIVAGMSALISSFTVHKKIVASALCISLVVLLPVHLLLAKIVTRPIHRLTQSERPFESYALFAESVNRLWPKALIILRINEIHHRRMLAYHLYPHEVTADWRNDPSIYGYLKKPIPKILNRESVVLTDQSSTSPVPGFPANVVYDAVASLEVAPKVVFTEGWYATEQDADHSWAWSSGEGIVNVNASRDMVVSLDASILSTKVPRQIQVFSGTALITTVLVDKGGLQAITPFLLPLKKGENVVRLLADGEPVQSERDMRPLSFALFDLSLTEPAKDEKVSKP